MDRLRSGFHRKPRKDSPSRPSIVTDTTTIRRSRNTTPEPGLQPALQVPQVPTKKTSSPVFRTLRDLSRSHKRARSPATASDSTVSPLSAMSARDSPSDRFVVSPHPLSAVSANNNPDDTPGLAAAAEQQRNAQPKIPSFLTIPASEIDNKFQDIIWLERNRTQAGASNSSPDFRWARLTSDHKKLDRYINIQPWENNRVRLCVPAGKQDYINASPIVLRSVSPVARSRTQRSNKESNSLENSTILSGEGEAVEDRYIAMQGPKQKTTDHTWRMIVEQLDSPAVIVMLTETHEGDHEKCFPYFPRSPDDAPLEIGLKDEFRDGFRASVRCEAIEETEAGEAIELRKLVVRVYKGVTKSGTTTATNGSGTTSTNGTTPATAADFPVDENGDVKMLSPAKTFPEHDSPPAAAADDDNKDSSSVTAQTGRASPADQSFHDAASAQQPTPKDDDAAQSPQNDEAEYEERIVWHFLYKKWPDFGVPALEDLDSFFTLMRLSREKNAQHPENPRIVHCSAGVGRSGTFIALEHLVRELDGGVLEDWDASLVPADAAKGAGSAGFAVKEGGDAASTEGHDGHAGETEHKAVEGDDDAKMDGVVVDGKHAEQHPFDHFEEEEDECLASDDLIFHTVNQLREQRRHMVQAEPQYHFLYQVLRKLWEDKYGSSAAAAKKNPSASPNPPGGDHPPRLSLTVDGEPAAKRVEFDPFFEE